jgi:uncharacterized surface protein with fasciclin (FAS1) repeats
VGVAETRPNLVDTLANDADSRFTTLLAAVEAAGLTQVLASQNDLTVLAPTNDAFAAALEATGLTAEALLADPETLSSILLLHVLPQRTRTSNLFGGATIASLQGENVVFTENEGGFLTANGVVVGPNANIIAGNGVIHVLNGVLLPAEIQAQVDANRTFVRFGHFSTDAGAIDIFIDGDVTDLQGVEFGTLSDWLVLPADSYEIGFAPPGGEPVVFYTLDVAAGSWTTVAVRGLVVRDTLTVQAIPEDFSPLPDGTVRLTMYHAIERAAPVDIRVDGRAVVTGLGYPGTLGDNDGVFIATDAAGTYTVTVTPAGFVSPVIVTVEGVALDAGQYYFLALIGTPGEPQYILVPTDRVAVAGE